jgi:hypothetical protein
MRHAEAARGAGKRPLFRHRKHKSQIIPVHVANPYRCLFLQSHFARIENCCSSANIQNLNVT